MTHPTDLQLSMHADDALVGDELEEVLRHLPTCPVCQQFIAVAQDEIRVIETSLQLEVAEDVRDIVIPKFSRPASLREFAIANIVTALVIWLAGFLWKTLFGELVMNGISWITSIYAPDIYEMSSTTALYYLQEGTAMLDAYLGLVVFSLFSITVVWFLLKYHKRRELVCLSLMLMMGATLVMPAPVNALEIRRDEAVVTVAESETIDDTLLAAAETVLIRGNVNGDLFVVGRRIDIDGIVSGNLVAFAETVIIRGTVGGLVLGAGSKYSLQGANVGGDVWAAGENVSVDKQAQVANNVVVAGQKTIISGSVGRDLFSFAEIVEIDGELGQDLEAFGNRVRLLDNAHVSGNARLHIGDEKLLDRSESARVDGQVEFLGIPEGLQGRNQYVEGEFYLWQAARIISAIIAGLLLLWLFPSFRMTSVSGGIEGLKTAGIGLLALLGVPIVGVLIAATLVGIPIAFFGILVWLILIYFAKIVVGAFIGRMMLGNTQYAQSVPLMLLVGITTIILVVNIPVIGGFISFVLTIIGIGLIVQRLAAHLSARSEVSATA